MALISCSTEENAEFYLIPTDNFNETMALISCSTGENAEFEVSVYLFPV